MLFRLSFSRKSLIRSLTRITLWTLSGSRTSRGWENSSDVLGDDSLEKYFFLLLRLVTSLVLAMFLIE